MGSLIGLTETKTFLQITGTATDALIDVYIGFVEAEVQTVLNRDIARATYTEYLKYERSTRDVSGYSGIDYNSDIPKYFLDNYPIISLELTHAGSVLTENEQYTYDASNGVITPQTVLEEPTATYVAGYTTVTAPSDIKGVLYLGVKSLYENNRAATQNGGNVKSKSIKDFSVTYGDAQSGYITVSDGGLVKNYIASNMPILKRYKRVDI